MELYSCEICFKIFFSKCGLSIHKNIHNKKIMYPCPVCSGNFENVEELTSHCQVHSEEKHYFCQLCQNSFSWHHALTYHLGIHSGTNLYTCKECQQSFKLLVDLFRHERVHRSQLLVPSNDHYSVVCDQSTQEQSRTQALTDNFSPTESTTKDGIVSPYAVQVKEDNKSLQTNSVQLQTAPTEIQQSSECLSYEVQIPSKKSSYPGISDFSVENLVNRKSLQINCSEVPSPPSVPEISSALPPKRNSINDLKIYTCKACQKPFKSYCGLLMHSNIHADQGKYPCLVCNNGFANIDDLYMHCKVHPAQEFYCCQVCHNTFPWNYAINQHLGVHTMQRVPLYL